MAPGFTGVCAHLCFAGFWQNTNLLGEQEEGNSESSGRVQPTHTGPLQTRNDAAVVRARAVWNPGRTQIQLGANPSRIPGSYSMCIHRKSCFQLCVSCRVHFGLSEFLRCNYCDELAPRITISLCFCLSWCSVHIRSVWINLQIGTRCAEVARDIPERYLDNDGATECSAIWDFSFFFRVSL